MSENFITTTYQIFQHWGLAGIFISMFFESALIPLPIEFAYLAAIQLIAIGKYSAEFLIIVITLGHISGSAATYFIGRKSDSWLHRRLVKNARFHDIHRRLCLWYKRYGALTVFGARFIGYVRPWSSLIAGLAEFPVKPFLLWTALGSLIFNIIALYASWTIVLLWKRYVALHFLIAVSFSISFGAVFLYELLKRRNHGSQKPESLP